ncbi:hypothetical protein K2Z84_19495, partial [Candidatus Binatia bacterium]|nr:hypothetical protein [Candidatus Binatia bacterium]
MSSVNFDNGWNRALLGRMPLTRRAARRGFVAWVLALLALLAVAPGTAGAATISCPSTSPDTCTGTRSALFALAHSNVDPTDVLVRVTIPAWSPGTTWGDGVNGFFYRVTAGSTVANYTPFNGMAVGSDGTPALPAFSFLVAVPETATTLEVAACASEFAGSDDTPSCTTTLWTDTYAPLPTPVLTEEPYGSATLVFSGNSTVLVPATGTYATAVQLTVTVEDDLGNPAPPADVQWLLDRLVFFDTAGNPQTNTIEPTGDPGNPQGIGILPLAQAAFQDPQSGDWLTKYGNTSPHTAPLAPSQLLFIYTRTGAGSQTTIGLSPIYDESPTCLGKTTAGCAAPSAPHPQLVVEAETDRATSQTVLDFDTGETLPAAGTQRTRRAQVLLTSPQGTCETLTNPLAVNAVTNGTATAYNPPDYVVDDAAPFGGEARGKTFPSALYYVVPAGFGSCASTAQPFCAATAGYGAYGPRYLDVDGNGGDTDAGSTTATALGGFEWHDEYGLPALDTADSNVQGFFDNCGYWHTYVEQVAGGQRLALSSLSLPDGRKPVDYTITNALGRDVVFAKECCASFYQTNTKITPNAQEPPHVLDNGFGAFVAAGATLSYQTIFPQEAMAVLDATTGARLFKVRLDADDATATQPYACEAAATIGVDGLDVTLGGDGASCTPGSDGLTCPFGATSAQNGAEYTCTFTDSSFALAVGEWARGLEMQDVAAVQVRAWGSEGAASDGGAGTGGFGLTVMAPGDLAAQDDPAIAEGAGGLFAYVGRDGSSTLLGQVPLSALSTSNGSEFEGSEPSALQVLALGGGGGGGGENGLCPDGKTTKTTNGKAGGAGGVAVANASSFPGAPQFAAGSQGTGASGSSGGCGGTGATSCSGGHGQGEGGPGGWSDGYGWNDDGSLIPVTTPWAPGKGAAGAGNGSGGSGCSGGEGGRGGGGFGGGGGGGTASGGGGGGSWAIGNTAYDATAPSAGSIPASPGGTGGAVQLAWVQGPCSLDRSGVRPVVRCTYTQSLVSSTALDVTGLVDTLFGDVDAGTLAQMPVYTEAWGARGGTGGTAAEDGGAVKAPGGAGGTHGYARSSQTWQSLAAFLGGADLQLYVGQVGSSVGQQPEADPSGGGGGSSTLVTSQVPSAGATSDPRA